MKATGTMMTRTHKFYIKKRGGWFYVINKDDYSTESFFRTIEEAEKFVTEISR